MVKVVNDNKKDIDGTLNITQLTNIESNYYLGVNALECTRRMKIGKDKVYRYYRLFKQGLTGEEIYFTYKQNKKRCGEKNVYDSNRS